MRIRTVRPSPRLVVVAIATLAIAGCSSPDAGSDIASDGSSSVSASVEATDVGVTALPAVQLVDVAMGVELSADTSVVIVDVRTPAEFAEGHLARADLIDLGAADFRDRIAELDRSATYLVYCQSGNRSGQATAIMAELGFDKVYDLDGGILAWQAAGAPVAK